MATKTQLDRLANADWLDAVVPRGKRVGALCDTYPFSYRDSSRLAFFFTKLNEEVEVAVTMIGFHRMPRP